MSSPLPQSKSVARGYRVWLLSLGCIVFGVLMGERTRFDAEWARALCAAIAFVVLGACIVAARKRVRATL